MSATATPSSDGPLLVDPGLAGVVVADTAIGDVRGQEGFFHYRQHSAVDLARHRSLEEIWHLVAVGALPADHQLRAFTSGLDPSLPPGVAKAVGDLAPLLVDAPPLEGMRTLLSLAATELGLRASLDSSPAELRAAGLRLCALAPTLVAALHRQQRDLPPVAPDPDQGYAAGYLRMLTGVTPARDHVRALEQYLALTIDHGFNSSTLTARVVTSTGADLGSALVAAIGALSGPLHGGAPSRALDMLDALDGPADAEAHIRDLVASGHRVMGFGHRVYTGEDPRSTLLREVAHQLGGPLVDKAVAVEQVALDVLAEMKPDRVLGTNVEFYAGVVMASVGIPRRLFTPTFAASRMIGWCAHVAEQAAAGRLIRPSSRYVGPPVVPSTI